MVNVCYKQIDEEKVYVYKGNYDNFLEQKSLRFEIQQSELQKDKNILSIALSRRKMSMTFFQFF